MATTLEISRISYTFPNETKEALSPIVRLEPLKFSEETLDLWVKWMNDPDIRQYMYASLTKNRDAIKDWLIFACESKTRHYFSIMVDNPTARKADTNIGFISIRQDKKPNDTAEIGIVIGEKEYQGKGIGTKVLKDVLTKCENDYHLSSVRALIKPFNEKSIKLFTSQGFVEDARVTVFDEPFIRFIKPFANKS